MLHLPMNAADTVAIILFLIAILFFYVGFTNDHTGYIVLGSIEVILGITQLIINRINITF